MLASPSPGAAQREMRAAPARALSPLAPQPPLQRVRARAWLHAVLRPPRERLAPSAANLAQSDCRSLSRSARAGPAASTHIWPRGAARPSGATPPAHATRRSLSAPTMRCASLWRPSGFAPSRPHTGGAHLKIGGSIRGRQPMKKLLGALIAASAASFSVLPNAWSVELARDVFETPVRQMFTPAV